MEITLYRNSLNTMELDISKEKFMEIFNPINYTQKALEMLDEEIKATNGLLQEAISKFEVKEIIDKIKGHKTYKQLVKAVGSKQAKTLIKVFLTTINFLIVNGVTTLAGTDIEAKARQFDTKMMEVFKLIAVIGGWLVVIFAIKEIIESLIRGEKDGLVGSMVKYVIIFIAILLMPTIIRFVREIILGW